MAATPVAFEIQLGNWDCYFATLVEVGTQLGYIKSDDLSALVDIHKQLGDDNLINYTSCMGDRLGYL